MPEIKFVAADGKERIVSCPVGTTVMKCAQMNAISGIYAECGGQRMCATCHVYVDEAFLSTLPPMSVDEDEMLEATASDRMPNSRLSCAIIVQPEHENLVVHLPEFQR
ncbi:2Fe-2S ferredoxin [Rhizobium leguminosarum]|uniref:2Fe-2S iron-sulfur cluster-binding protein n=1 Tax=Rhizobium leguminosarum TaxID=384 RepID=UPI0024B37262|nr:2Fe-2S iron-sulfur cluster-binding protein [Rhizobium leguminosarum]WHO82627.1 2Fe-2S iron-sulfur cluster-binding protein [Rhizobium leguminosarum]